MTKTGTNLKTLLAAALLTIGMMSCNQPNADDTKTTKNDSTDVENVEAPAADVKAAKAKEAVSNFDGTYKIVFIDTDSLVSRYKFFTDGNEKMIRVEENMRNQYEAKAKKLQKEYEEYMRQGKAGLLTLKQQQDTEASLTAQQQKLVELDKTMSEQLIMQKQLLNKQINDTVAKFIDAYRIEKGYTYILQKQTLNGVLSGDPALDITEDVISRLNAKYEFDKNH
jgi:outer membrane protein